MEAKLVAMDVPLYLERLKRTKQERLEWLKTIYFIRTGTLAIKENLYVSLLYSKDRERSIAKELLGEQTK